MSAPSSRPATSAAVPARPPRVLVIALRRLVAGPDEPRAAAVVHVLVAGGAVERDREPVAMLLVLGERAEGDRVVHGRQRPGGPVDHVVVRVAADRRRSVARVAAAV